MNEISGFLKMLQLFWSYSAHYLTTKLWLIMKCCAESYSFVIFINKNNKHPRISMHNLQCESGLLPGT